jgi:hypothetical protein
VYQMASSKTYYCTPHFYFHSASIVHINAIIYFLLKIKRCISLNGLYVTTIKATLAQRLCKSIYSISLLGFQLIEDSTNIRSQLWSLISSTLKTIHLQKKIMDIVIASFPLLLDR